MLNAFETPKVDPLLVRLRLAEAPGHLFDTLYYIVIFWEANRPEEQSVLKRNEALDNVFSSFSSLYTLKATQMGR